MLLLLKSWNECDISIDMSRIISAVTLILFTVWILPLGIFIAPSKEKLACAGQRAICLCSMKMAKSNKTSEKISFASDTETAKEEGASSSGHYFLLLSLRNHLQNNISQYFVQNAFFHKTSFRKAIEHVPKT